MSVSRRGFLGLAATTLAFGGLSQACARTGVDYVNQIVGYGDLKPDPAGIFDLPEGFSYKVISEFGQPMDDGLLTPGRMDGMGCFPAGPGRVALVRNHEIYPADLERSAFGADGALAAKVPADRAFDVRNGKPFAGGTSNLVWDLRAQKLVSHHMSLAGTMLNCAGGVTPRNTWLTCEETTQRAGIQGTKDHGWVFEVPANAKGLVEPLPIKAMGRFRHEATATDPRTGIVYLTEDMADGLFYRYLPNDPNRLLAGGRLQALGLKARDLDIRNWKEPSWRVGDWQETVWIDIEDPESPGDDLRMQGKAKGAVLLARGEGLFFGQGSGGGEVFITCTSGGPANHCQILRYVPSPQEGKAGEKDQPGRLQLFVEPNHPDILSMADNIAVAPWGHLFVCEDKGLGQNQLKAVTPKGEVYTVGRNAEPAGMVKPVNTELAGACFSPDGSTLFLNLYSPGKTLAITGPWGSLRA
jgi:secreted PhoX family phosphatase